MNQVIVGIAHIIIFNNNIIRNLQELKLWIRNNYQKCISIPLSIIKVIVIFIFSCEYFIIERRAKR